MGASLFIAPSLFAQIVNTGNIGTGSLYITAPNFSANGDQAGPYLVQNLTVSTGVTPVSTTFQTFCVGTEVNYYPGNTYDYQISDVVQPAAGVGSPGYVTWGTAYLYSQFLAGDLGVGGHSTTVAGGTANELINDALQVAIWELQGQSLSGITLGESLSTAEANAAQYLTDAANAASGAHTTDTANADGAFNIYALNMYSGSTYAQPQLVEVTTPPPPSAPVPEPSTVIAGALLLVPLGLSTFRVVRNRLKQREV